MRLLICSLNFSPELTGIGKYSGEMAAWLAQQGHDVRVITTPPYYPHWRVADGYSSWRYRKEKLASGVFIWRCPLWVPQHPSGFKRLLHLLSFALSSLPVLLMQLRWKPDVIITIEPALACLPAVRLLGRLTRAKTWLHVQDFEVDAAFELGLLKSALLKRVILFVERRIMSNVDCVSSISERMCQRLTGKGVAAEKQLLFPNWVDTDTIFPSQRPAELLQALNISDQSVIALYAGNMGEKQGLEILLAAARHLQQESDIVFVLSGEGAAKQRLVSQAQSLANIRWLPLQPTEQLNALLNLADIHVLPQRQDAQDLVMPSKLGGMLASGRPVIATVSEDSQIAKVLAGCGLVVSPGDARSLAGAIFNLAKNPVLRTQLGQCGRQYALEHLRKEKILGDFHRHLLRLH